MKNITLIESDLLKIVKRVLNEQEDRRLDEDEIDLLHFIFERELKPPFRKGEKDNDGDYPYYNRDGEYFGWLGSYDDFVLFNSPFWHNIKYKVCQVFGFPRNTWEWWDATKPHLKFWMEDQLNIKLRYIKL